MSARLVPSAAVAVLLLATPSGPASAQPRPAAAAPASFADIVERVAPAVVSVDARGVRRATAASAAAPAAPVRLGTGAGFFISADGYIVTNNHVVGGAESVVVRTHDQRTLDARVVGRDPATDLAVLKVEGGRFPSVPFASGASPRVGDWVVAVGNPYDLGGTVTAGIVSAVARRGAGNSAYVDYLQVDAPINFGNSGGPSFDLQGRVVGVNTIMASPTGGSVGIGFAIPSDVAAEVVRDLIRDGRVVRGYIGANVQDLSAEEAQKLGLPARAAAVISGVVPDGPAAAAGLRPGDVVLRMNGRDVGSSVELIRAIGGVRVGEQVRLSIRRDGRAQEVVLRSGARPDQVT